MTWWDWFVPEAKAPDQVERDPIFEAHIDEIKRAREAAEARVRKLEDLMREVVAVRPWPTHARGLRSRISEALIEHVIVDDGTCKAILAQVEKDRQVVAMIRRLQDTAWLERDEVTLKVCAEALDGDTEARLEVGTLYAAKFKEGDRG